MNQNSINRNSENRNSENRNSENHIPEHLNPNYYIPGNLYPEYHILGSLNPKHLNREHHVPGSLNPKHLNREHHVPGSLNPKHLNREHVNSANLSTVKFLLFTLLLSALAFPSLAANITVTFTGLKVPQGNIIVGIYDNADAFPKDGGQIKKIFVPVNNTTVTTTISLSKGEYAFAVCHDENGDGTCNQNMLGIPTEGFAFSNNYRPRFKVPTFNDVKIKVTDKDLKLKIKLIYF